MLHYCENLLITETSWFSVSVLRETLSNWNYEPSTGLRSIITNSSLPFVWVMGLSPTLYPIKRFHFHRSLKPEKEHQQNIVSETLPADSGVSAQRIQQHEQDCPWNGDHKVIRSARFPFIQIKPFCNEQNGNKITWTVITWTCYDIC